MFCPPIMMRSRGAQLSESPWRSVGFTRFLVLSEGLGLGLGLVVEPLGLRLGLGSAVEPVGLGLG